MSCGSTCCCIRWQALYQFEVIVTLWWEAHLYLINYSSFPECCWVHYKLPPQREYQIMNSSPMWRLFSELWDCISRFSKSTPRAPVLSASKCDPLIRRKEGGTLVWVLFCLLVFRDRVSLCNSSECARTHPVDQASLSLEFTENPPGSASRILGLKTWTTSTTAQREDTLCIILRYFY